MKNKHNNRFDKTFKLHEVKELQKKQKDVTDHNRVCYGCGKEVGEFDCNITYLWIKGVGHYFHHDPCVLKYLGRKK